MHSAPESVQCYAFRNSFQRFVADFRNDSQQDAGEFVMYLLDILEKEGNAAIS